MGVYPRFVLDRIVTALADTRVVLISGPRQSGKTTLAKKIAADKIPFLNLDEKTILDAAQSDPVGFVRNLDRAVIDEIQRVPELLLAIKTAVDEDPRPGRFLLTGSANLMTLPRVSDSLAGRMEVVPLLPLAQAELKGTPTTFLETVFQGRMPKVSHCVLGPELHIPVLSGGYPEALARSDWRRRQDWLLNYAEAVVQRDIRDIAQIEKLPLMPRLLRMLAHHSGQLVNHSGIGTQLGLAHPSVQKYTGIFESLFLVCHLQPWTCNAIKRISRKPKLHFFDSGLLAALKNLTPDSLKKNKSPFGPVLETFVLAELWKLANCSGEGYRFSHFRDKEKNEVDIVIEDRHGRVVAIEVKASATVISRDLVGMRRLERACGDRFVLGLVLYDHEQIVPFGDRLFAVPISALWG